MSKLKAISELVWSLQGREKVYIDKLINKKAKYRQLYEALLSHNPYIEEGEIVEEKKVREILKAVRLKVNAINNKTALASNLSKTVFKGLRAYRAELHQYDQIKTALIDYQIVKEKNLKFSKKEKLKEARKMAETMGDSLSLLEINREDRYLLWLNPVQGRKSIDLQLKEEGEHLFKEMREEMDFWNIYFELFSARLHPQEQQKYLSHTSPQESFEHAFSHLSLAQSMHVKKRFLMAKTMYYQIIKDSEQLRNTAQEILQWWEEYDQYRNENSHLYVRDLTNYIITSLNSGRYEGIEEQFKMLDQVGERKTKLIKQFIFEQSILLRLFYYMNRKFYAQGKRLIPRIEQGLKKYKIDLSTRVLLIYNTCSFLFLAMDYHDCYQWCKRFQKEKTDIKKNLHHASQLIRLVAIFELEYGMANKEAPGNFQYELNKSRRYFKKISDVEYQRMGLGVCAKLRAFHQATSHKEVHLSQLEVLLKQILDSTTQKRLSGLEELLVWLEKKLAPPGRTS